MVVTTVTTMATINHCGNKGNDHDNNKGNNHCLAGSHKITTACNGNKNSSSNML